MAKHFHSTTKTRLPLTAPRPFPKGYKPNLRSVYDRIPFGIRGKPYKCSARTKKLANPRNYYLPGYKADNLTPYIVSSKALDAIASERVEKLSVPRSQHPEWLPPRYPYWNIREKALRAKTNLRIEKLARPLVRFPLYPVASSFKLRGAADDRYLKNLAEHRPRHPEFRHPRLVFWKMTDSLRNYQPTDIILNLSQPLQKAETNLRDSSVVSRAALRYTITDRILELTELPERYKQ